MIRELSIRNFAIIEDLRIQFNSGLTILSGETGAGKSIIINAVNLLLGGRASTQLIRTGEKAAELEALFNISANTQTAKSMIHHGFEIEEGLIVRRIISKNNRHKIYINGRLTTLQILADITANLVSISGQHAHQKLLKEESHLSILDQYGGLEIDRQNVSRLYKKIVPLKEKLEVLQQKLSRQKEFLELLTFQRSEIEDASLKPFEDQELEEERQSLKSATATRQVIHNAIEILYYRKSSVSEQLSLVEKSMANAAQNEPGLKGSVQLLTDLSINLEDIVDQLRQYQQGLDLDEGRLDIVETRLDKIQKLKRKYGGSIGSILETLSDIELKINDSENIASVIEEVQENISVTMKALLPAVRSLTQKRQNVSKKLGRKVAAALSNLNMQDTQFSVRLTPINASQTTSRIVNENNELINSTGADHAVFMIATNIGEKKKPLAEIVSGGELSRIVLALKTILAQSEYLETIVFDEADAGIGGETALVVGRQITELAKYHQVLCITHLPQIAKFGTHHLYIHKEVVGGRTRTHISPLDGESRLQEMARMLGGETRSNATLAHAREMLDLSQEKIDSLSTDG